jgi:hypothetical protein
VSWPGGELALLGVLAFTLALSLGLVRILDTMGPAPDAVKL